jgi:hypothetical protein
VRLLYVYFSWVPVDVAVIFVYSLTVLKLIDIVFLCVRVCGQCCVTLQNKGVVIVLLCFSCVYTYPTRSCFAPSRLATNTNSFCHP